VEQETKLQDQVPNLPLEPLPEMELKSAELKTLPQSQLIQPEEDVVEKVEDCDLNGLSISFQSYFNLFALIFFNKILKSPIFLNKILKSPIQNKKISKYVLFLCFKVNTKDWGVEKSWLYFK